MEINDDILRLLQKYLSGDLSPEEATNFEIELEVNPELKEYLDVGLFLKDFWSAKRSWRAIEAAVQTPLEDDQFYSIVLNDEKFIDLQQLQNIQFSPFRLSALRPLYMGCALSLESVSTDKGDLIELSSNFNDSLYKIAKNSFISKEIAEELIYSSLPLSNLIASYFLKIGSRENVVLALGVAGGGVFMRGVFEIGGASISEKLFELWRPSLRIWENILNFESKDISTDFEASFKEKMWHKDLANNLKAVQKRLTKEYFFGEQFWKGTVK